MERTLQVLLIGESSLRGEIDGVLGELPDEMRLALHSESDQRRGVEHAINRAPDLVLLELGDDVANAHRIVSEIATGAPDLILAGVYRPQVLGSDVDAAPVLIDLMRAGVRDFLRRPVSVGEVEDLLRRHFAASGRSRGTRGRIISFMGNKGGVGKSTLSLSTACSLARQLPGSVLLVDASLQHGAMRELLGLNPTATISDAARQIDRLDERLLRMLSVSHESGLRVLAAPPNAIEAAPVDDESIARVLSVARRAFDYVIVDTFPLIDGVTVAILDVADMVFVVLNDLVPAVVGTAELLKVLTHIGIPEERVRVVLNHSSSGFRGRLAATDIAQRLSHDLDFVVPFDRRVLSATNTGEPYVLRAARWRGFGRAIRNIQEEILSSASLGLQAREPGADAEPSPPGAEGDLSGGESQAPAGGGPLPQATGESW